MTSPFSGKINSLIGSLIYDPELAEKQGSFYENLTVTQTQALNKLIWQVWRREITLEGFLAEATKFNLLSFKEKIWPGILRYDFLPLADYLGISINEWLNYLSAEEASKLKIVSFNKWLEDYLQEREIILVDKSRIRIVSILKNFIGGDDEEKTIKTLGQTEKLGGVSLAESEARKLVGALRNRFEKVVEQNEILTAQEVNIPVVQQPAISNPHPKAETQNVASVQKFIPVIQLYDQSAEDLIRKSGLVVAPDLRQRFKIIIISRLKDIRKIPETRERLTAAPLAGGVGLNLEDAEKVIKMIEESDKKSVEEPKVEPPPPAPLMLKITEVKQAPPTIVKPVTSPQQPAKTPPLPAASRSVSKPISAPIPVSSDIKEAAVRMVKIISQAKAAPKVELAPLPPPPAKPKPILAIPQASSGRSKVEDVAYKPRLLGPIEELKEMRLIDFRRLSPHPKVTADKIYAKIELLAGESYEQKIKGIQAWQKSPVNQVYVAILHESLSRAAPVGQVIEERKKAGGDVLTPEEFKAVMELNRKLRY